MVEQTVHVAAAPGVVWSVLEDVEQWPEWTESIDGIEPLDSQQLAVGSRYRIRQPGFPAMIWTVTELEEGSRFAWRAKSIGVTTDADHILVPAPDGGTTVRLVVREQGPLAWLIRLVLGGRTERYVRMEAAGLKVRAEAYAPTTS